MDKKGSSSPSGARRAIGCAIATIVVSVLVQSCATSPTGTQFSLHPPVTVSVVPRGSACPDRWTCWTSGQWTIQLSEEPIDTTNDVPPVEIHWLLRGSSWTFDRKGIDFKGHGPFHEEPVGTNGTEYKVTSSRKDGQIYKYQINLKGPSAASLFWDPTVMN